MEANNNVKVLAQAFNLLVAAKFDGLTGHQVVAAGAQIEAFQDIIKSLVDGKLAFVEVTSEAQ